MWNKYVRRVRSGAWGDNIVIAALCNMFSITINVLSVTNQYTNTVIMTPMSGVSRNEINIGLVMQYHFVALVPQTTDTETTSVNMNETSNDSCSQQTESNSKSAVCDIDDAVIEEGGLTMKDPKSLHTDNQRLLDVDARFARDLDYLFVAKYIVESKQVFDDANNFV